MEQWRQSLRVENVTSGYDGIPINRSVSLEVAEGPIQSLLWGDNGVANLRWHALS